MQGFFIGSFLDRILFFKRAENGLKIFRGDLNVLRLSRGQHGACQVGFALLQFLDFLLQSSFCDQFVNEYRFILSYTPCTVRCLIFNSGVPPGIIVDDGIGCGQVQTDAAGFQTDQEDGNFAFLEIADRGSTVGSIACQQRIRYPADIQFRFNK